MSPAPVNTALWPDHAFPGARPPCRDAVVRCYDGLCRCGQPERYAREAAVTVFLYHHPEADPAAAEDIVGLWLAGPFRH